MFHLRIVPKAFLVKPRLQHAILYEDQICAHSSRYQWASVARATP